MVLLDEKFYQRRSVTKIAQELLGKTLFTKIKGKVAGGMIVETEAYSWKEKGCHAYNKKLTQRTSVMFLEGGRAYVYFCYGMHHMFNIVTNREGVAEAVLVRAVEPVTGIDIMQERRGRSIPFLELTSGPGKLTKAMGIDRSFNGKKLADSDLWIERGESFSASQIVKSKRIGIDYAGNDASLLWRFTIKDNKWTSKRPST